MSTQASASDRTWPFAPAKIGFSGLGFVARRPFTMLTWALIPSALAFAMLTPIGSDLWSSLALAPIMLLLIAVFDRCIGRAAAYRSVFEPAGGWGGLRIGEVEGRLWLIDLYLWRFLPGWAGGLYVMAVPLAVAGWLVMRAAPAPLGPPLGAAVLAAAALIAIWLKVRGSLAHAACFWRDADAAEVGWRLSRGRFWPLLAMHLCAIGLWLGLSLATGLAVWAVMGRPALPSSALAALDLLQPADWRRRVMEAAAIGAILALRLAICERAAAKALRVFADQQAAPA